MERFPKSLISFQRMFPDEAACAAWLALPSPDLGDRGDDPPRQQARSDGLVLGARREIDETSLPFRKAQFLLDIMPFESPHQRPRPDIDREAAAEDRAIGKRPPKIVPGQGSAR